MAILYQITMPMSIPNYRSLTPLTEGTVDDWRRDLLSELDNYAAFDNPKIVKVIWLTASDENVCPLCAAREGQHYTIEEVKKELEGEFCKPLDPDDRCRCTFIVDESCFEDDK